jgi:hypothetical protein
MNFYQSSDLSHRAGINTRFVCCQTTNSGIEIRICKQKTRLVIDR